MSPTNTSLLRLLQLVSPALPVGAYAWSQGLEAAVESGQVHDEAAALEWIGGVMQHGMASLDLPVLLRLHRAWSLGDAAAVERWSEELMASRETAEFRSEDRHIGSALGRLLTDLGVQQAASWRERPAWGYATLFALAATHWDIDSEQALSGYLWAWCENQVAAAIKLVPLGQTAGQRMLGQLIDRIPATVEHAQGLPDDDIGSLAPGLVLASCHHEDQYSRLFRS